MSEEEPVTLKYGDRVILRCTIDNKCYFFLMRGEQYWMETQLQSQNARASNLYYFQQHMVFTIFPKLLYEAQKKFNSDKGTGSNQDIQRQLLQTRMETEKRHNQSLIRTTQGKVVLYGETIMLYQELCQVFLSKQENLTSNSNSILGPHMYFIIQPDPLGLDLKLGSPVRSFDQFLLVQQDSILKLDNLEPIFKLPEISNSNNFDHDMRYLTIPAIIENQHHFKFYKAQYKQYQNDTKEKLSQNALQAIVLPKLTEPTYLHYGQYVRIKHYQSLLKQEVLDKRVRSIKAEDKQEFAVNKGYITSSINASGCYPSVFLQVNDILNEDVLERATSIFQIVPDTDNKYGSQVTFNVGNKPNLVGHTTFLLRHLLTGLYLTVSQDTLQLELSKNLISKYVNIASSQKKPDKQKLSESTKISMKNLSGLRLYQNLLNSTQDERLTTLPQQQTQQDEVFPATIFQSESLLFLTKLGSNPTFHKDQLPFTFETQFTIATPDGKMVIEIDSQDVYVTRQTRQTNFNQQAEESNPEFTLKRQLHEEWLLLIPELEMFYKKPKSTLSAQDKLILDFIEKEEKSQASIKKDMGHFKQSGEKTYISAFINMNPLKTRFYDAVAGTEFTGSTFMFEKVSDEEIQTLNELTSWLYPIVNFAKHPMQLTALKFRLQNLRFKDQRELSFLFHQLQNNVMQSLAQCTKSLIKIMLWISDTHESLAMESMISEPIVQRQTLLREIGCIDFVIKILYELHVNGLLYQTQDSILQDDELFEQELNSLIAAISSFLQLVCKNSQENSYYTIQWYLLYKIILLEGQLNDLMRLDILVTYLFQQTDTNVTFQKEVEDLSKKTKYANYNQNAYNLLIAFCLFTKFRQKEGVEEIIQLIFIQNRETIFAELSYDENMQISLRNRLHQYENMLSYDSGGQLGSPNLISKNTFINKASKHDYLISCVRLASEIAKSSPSITLKHIKVIFPFHVCVSVIQDTQMQASTRYNFLELLQNSYLAKHLLPLPNLQLPQLMKLLIKQQDNGFLGLFKKQSCRLSSYIYSQKKISDIYKKVQSKYLTEGPNAVDFWFFLSHFLSNFWKQRTIYEVKPADHQYIKQLLLTFTLLFKKGLFIENLQDAYNFYNMYHKFIEFLKTSLVSALLEEQYMKHQLHGKKRQNDSKPQEIKDYLFENQVSSKKQNRSSYQKGMIWLDELIDILILLERYQQNQIVDQFIMKEDHFTVFDDLLYLQKFATQSKYQNVVQKLKMAKKQSQNVRASAQKLDSKDILTTQSLTKILRECSFSRKTLILEYMSGIKQADVSLIYFLTELLTFNQIRLSASVTELIWVIYSTRSSFLSILNQTLLVDQEDEAADALTPNLSSSISREFSNIYWKLHFAIINLKKSLEQDSQKNYESINDALSDILVIVYPDYAARSDMQMFMEINQLENEERHNQAQEQKMVKSKVRQEQMNDNLQSKVELDMIDQSQYSPARKNEREHSVKSQTNADNSHRMVWRINNSLSIDVISIYQRQKLLRYIGFHELLQQLIEDLIEETRGTLVREKGIQLNQKKSKGWEIKSEIIEKAVLFLIYFVIRNEENQELILNTSLKHDSYLHKMTNVERKQLQNMTYIMFAELFRDNYNILFYLDKYSMQDSLLQKLFHKFGTNIQEKNYEAAIYFIQFVGILLRAKDSDVVQNNELIISLLNQTKSMAMFNRDFKLLISTLSLRRVEQHRQGVGVHLDTPQHRRRPPDSAFVEVPIEILFMQQYIKLLSKICAKRSQSIDSFIKKTLPLSMVEDMMLQLDDWFTLKYELLQYIKVVFLQNASILSHDERADLSRIITEIVFKQLTLGYLDNPQIKKYFGVKMQNNQLFNIYGSHAYYSTQELIISVDFEKCVHVYVIHGVLEICRLYTQMVMPRYFNHPSGNSELELFDEKAKNELSFLAAGFCDVLTRVKESFQERPSQHHFQQTTRKKTLATKKKNKNLQLTHKLLSNNQEDEQGDLQEQMPLEDNEEEKQFIIRIYEICRFVQQSDYGFQLTNNEIVSAEMAILTRWDTSVKAHKKKLVDEHLIVSEREQEIQQLINLIITLKRDNTEKFKQMVASLIQILSEDSVSSNVKLKSINILRKLSNYKEDQMISKSILKDLSELGFTDFLCDLIKQEQNSEQKLEYIKAFVDYIDDSSTEIQNSFFVYLQRDPTNSFLLSLQQSVIDLFSDIRMAEISNVERKNHSIAHIINNKINACIYIFELLRLACEDHFDQMQNFLRTQPNAKQELNFIVFTADLFEKYAEIMNENNAPLGQKLLDFLIECVQGPCFQNQIELCHSTKILEVLEQIILDQRIDHRQFQRRDIQYSNLRAKIFLLQLSLMEGNRDQEIAKKISQYFNPQVLFERIELIYWKIIKKIKNTQIGINLEVKILNRIKSEGDEQQQNAHGIIQTKDTRETLPNQDIFMEFFNDSDQPLSSPMKSASGAQSLQVNSISEEDMENMVNESFTMYLLLKKLSNFIPEIKSFQEDGSSKLKKSLTYYKNHTASIEIVNMNGNLEKIYFQLPTLMLYLTEDTKHQFLEQVGRDSINDKINGLLDNMDGFYMEMVHFMKLKKLGIRYNNQFIVYLRNFCIIIAFMINLLITIDDTDDGIMSGVNALAIINVVLYAIILFVWVFVRMQLEYDKINKEVSDFIKLNYFKKKVTVSSKNSDEVIVYPFQITLLQNLLILRKILFNSYTFYWLLLLLFCILALAVNKLFYGLLLLDIIDHSPVLRNVIKSISLNYRQLLMTALLGILIMYLYSLIAYQSDDFRMKLQMQDVEDTSGLDEDDPGRHDYQVCYSSFQCWIYMVHQGLRAGGGVGDTLASPKMYTDKGFYAQRVLFDVSFYIIINIICLNIIFGTIIDTFAELRDTKNQRDFDSQNRCFICNLSRTIFEKEGVSFDNHIMKYHNPWNYLAYMVYLKVKARTEHTGIESYVSDKITKRDISWFPILKALDLELLGVTIKNEEQE